MPDLDAHHYRLHSSNQYQLAHEMIDKIQWRGNETVMDVGCGDGRLTAELSLLAPCGRVLGIDSSSSMIELAKSSFLKENYPNLTFSKMAAEEIDLKSFADAIFLLNVLHWIRKPQQALKNLAATLKKGGTLFILTYPKEFPYLNFLEKTIQQKKWQPYASQTTYNTILKAVEYKKALDKAGLYIQEFFLEEKVMIYASKESLIGYVKGWLNCYVSLPKEQEAEFLEESCENARLFSIKPHPHEIHLPYTKLTIVAKR